MFRDYKVFCAKTYRLCVWGLYPLLVVIGNCIYANRILAMVPGADTWFMTAAELAFLVPTTFLVPFEVFIEDMFIRDINRKGVGGFLYLQSSKRGVKLFEDAIRVDLGRKILMLLGSNTLIYFLGRDQFGFEWDVFMEASFIEYAFVIIGVLISKWFCSLSATLIIAVIMMQISSLMVSLYVAYAPRYGLINSFILMVVVILQNLYLYLMTRKGRGSYYDE